MEDLDTPRVRSGSAAEILRVLEALELSWDGAIEYQSSRIERYSQALETVRSLGLTYACSCSRADRAGIEVSGYPGTCRAGPTRSGPTSTRFRIEDATRQFDDRIQGSCEFDLRALGDVIVQRRDRIYAYHLAVVVDDAAQGVTHVVRGADLLASTPWHIELQRALGLPRPQYAHLPVVVEPGGAKLAKSRRSVAINPHRPSAALVESLRLLQQDPPAELEGETPAAVLGWALTHWRPARFSRMPSVPVTG
jgi:glutamyl-Q tRNA(Asp) synthetase